MSDRNNPGPDLIMEDEFCTLQPPTVQDYLKASVTALLTVPFGAGIWVLMVFLFQRISGLTGVLIAVGIARLIHLAAGRRRSVALGALAAVSGLIASLLGFGMLWVRPLINLKVPHQLNWYHILMLVVGVVAAYGMTTLRDRDIPFQKKD